MSVNSIISSLFEAVILILAFLVTITVTSANAQEQADEITWRNVLSLHLEGKGWQETEADYDRLPAKANGIVTTAVWNLSHCSAGMCVRFICNASTIQARWKLIKSNLALPHMPATGVSGLDLYVKMQNGSWRWLGAGRPSDFPENTKTLVSGISPEKREYLLYLPLYNGVEVVEIGVPKEFEIIPAPSRDKLHQRPIVFYGTSITQGACASRPGMASTAIVGRQLDFPIINLGFSGNGKMEPEMAKLLGELDPAIYIIDCLPNMVDSMITERAEPFLKILRAARPETPIILSEGIDFGAPFLRKSMQKRHLTSRKALRLAYENLVAAGYKNIHYVYAANQYGADGEGAVDGTHATDLGFMRQAKSFTSLITAILPESR